MNTHYEQDKQWVLWAVGLSLQKIRNAGGFDSLVVIGVITGLGFWELRVSGTYSCYEWWMMKSE